MTTLGWIGTGIMGRNMAWHLLNAGYPLNVYNRTKSKAAELLDAGAVWYSSPKAVAQNSDIVFLMVGFPQDVRETILGQDGVLEGIKPHGIIVDMTTSSPALAKEIEAECRKKNVISLDAPVSGGDRGAKNATLSIMIGGDKQTAESLTPFWNLMGKTVVYHGASGNGQHAKMVNQTLIAGNMIGLCEAILYGFRSGLDMEKVLQSVSGGAAGSWSLTNLAPRILKKDFAPGFMIEHFIKDLGIVLEESRRMGLALPGLALAEQLYIAAKSKGYAQNGTQALFLALAELNGVDYQPE
ncbi:MAG: NAD(P)-dependent oxidoreductase [Planctomycetaceae bacterium]|jgi:3-hydroxyisobutyrate dehydrogenase|nr:NAD(P)-dependent oxidoreductase [Planctomycetaceae bacterium]